MLTLFPLAAVSAILMHLVYTWCIEKGIGLSTIFVLCGIVQALLFVGYAKLCGIEIEMPESLERFSMRRRNPYRQMIVSLREQIGELLRSERLCGENQAIRRIIDGCYEAIDGLDGKHRDGVRRRALARAEEVLRQAQELLADADEVDEAERELPIDEGAAFEEQLCDGDGRARQIEATA